MGSHLGGSKKSIKGGSQCRPCALFNQVIGDNMKDYSSIARKDKSVFISINFRGSKCWVQVRSYSISRAGPTTGTTPWNTLERTSWCAFNATWVPKSLVSIIAHHRTVQVDKL